MPQDAQPIWGHSTDSDPSTNWDPSAEIGGSLPRISECDPVFATVLVGPDAIKFVIHESLLVYYSTFFCKALTGEFKEAKEKSVKLEDEDPRTFEIFVHWLYYQRLPDKDMGDNAHILEMWQHAIVDQDEIIDEDDQSFRSDNCIEMYIFGDKYAVEKLSLHATQLLGLYAKNCKEIPRSFAVKKLFDLLPQDSPLCVQIIKLFCELVDPKNDSQIQNYTCIPFLHGIWRQYGKDRAQERIRRICETCRGSWGHRCSGCSGCVHACL
ncbi:hypothetical protein GQ44DRAFT_823579 [Phaeosphaeriaceae sp. PMI808]|nr:hypothetical protein GQ44DRAFT_823579 [Phaeosphaeriaceae sp. PMI808]